MKILVKCVVALAILVSSSAFAAETVEDRIKPAGKVCMAGESCAAAPLVVASAGAAARSGSDVYTAKCAMCHASGAAGAPKLGDVTAWAPRIGQGVETLYTHAIAGFNGMPAKGLCFDCSDDEIKAAVDHMVVGSK